jgi:hypothetical protein
VRGDVSTNAWEFVLDDGFDVAATEPVDPGDAIYAKREKPLRLVALDDISNLPTRVLMSYLHVARIHGYYLPYEHGKEISLVAIKDELAKCPHVPSKREARALRQLRAKRRGDRCPPPERLLRPPPERLRPPMSEPQSAPRASPRRGARG